MNEKTDDLLNRVSADNSKLEVVVKHDAPQYGETEIDLVNVFTNMGKKKNVFIWVLCIGIVLGILIPFLINVSSNKVDEVSGVITLNYPKAGKLLAPDGSPLDMGFIMSSHVVSEALKESKLDKKVSTSAVSANMQVKRMLSDKTKQQLEILEKFDEAQLNASNPAAYIDAVNGIEYSYRNAYIITMSNGFGEKKTILSGDEISLLLNTIMDVFSNYFF